MLTLFEGKTAGVIGAGSLVGQCLLPLLTQAGCKIVAFSRQPMMQSCENVIWFSAASARESLPNSSNNQLRTTAASPALADPVPAISNAMLPNHIPYWICLAPLWVLPEYFQALKASGAKRVVALSSTSRFTKDHSPDASERLLAQRLMDAEARIQAWAEQERIEWVILRPTLIYGLGKDKNIHEIIRLIRRFGFFPLIGEAHGLRQPVHAEDVAIASLSALSAAAAANKSYNISGGETLTYKKMVERVFIGLGRKPFYLKVPKSLMRLFIMILRCLPRYRDWKLSMAERMNQDLVFEHLAATQDLNYAPRPFRLETDDLT